MLTQLELLGGTGSLVDDGDGGVSVSPLDGLGEYPIEQTEFEYFETGFPSDSYYDVPNTHDLSPPLPPTQASTPPSMIPMEVYDTSTQAAYDHHVNTVFETNGYENAIVLYDQEDIKPSMDALKTFVDIKPEDVDMKHFEDDVKPELDDLRFDESEASYDGFPNTGVQEAISTCNRSAIFSFGSMDDDFGHVSDLIEEKLEAHRSWDEVASGGKGKIGPLQRRALDAIFSVTDKPSRGLVLHIASELSLHHLTVKNFFSNGRRRLRRAAARLNDPERTKRENERRKEKRRIAALASATVTNEAGSVGSVGTKTTSRTPPAESPPPKDPPVVSAQRRALMEKLADKVQRSVAQRTLAADPDVIRNPENTLTTPVTTTITPDNFLTQTVQDLLSQPSNDILSQSSSDILCQSTNDILCQSTSDILSQSSNDILSQASQDILAESTRELLGSSHDFLSHSVNGMDVSPSHLLHAHSDPWSSLF